MDLERKMQIVLIAFWNRWNARVCYKRVV